MTEKAGIIMICKYCGKKMAPEDTVCPHCHNPAAPLIGGNGFWDMAQGPAPQAPDSHTPDSHTPDSHTPAPRPHAPAPRAPEAPVPRTPAPAQKKQGRSSELLAGISLILSVLSLILLLFGYISVKRAINEQNMFLISAQRRISALENAQTADAATEATVETETPERPAPFSEESIEVLPFMHPTDESRQPEQDFTEDADRKIPTDTDRKAHEDTDGKAPEAETDGTESSDPMDATTGTEAENDAVTLKIKKIDDDPRSPDPADVKPEYSPEKGWLRCTAAHAGLRFRWEKNVGGRWEELTRDDGVTETTGGLSSTLTLADAPDCFGTYRCIALKESRDGKDPFILFIVSQEDSHE